MQKIKAYFLLLLFSITALCAWATVSEYSFASSLGTFTEISGGIVLGTATNDNESFNAIPLGFTFTYNDVAYTEVSIQANGYLAMGSVVASSYQVISSATATNNVVAALNRDIKGRDTGELMYLLSGTAPNRVFTVQWKHYRRSATATANDDFNFQIQLLEGGNKVSFAYGAFSTVTNTAAQAVQVGLRGNANTDFNNRATATDWSATTSGTANNNFCVLSATVFPASGLLFTFTPPAIGEPPLAAQNPIPVNGATNITIAANLSWVSGGGTVDGYKVFLGTDNPPTNIVNGITQTAASFDPADFAYSTSYNWKIVPYNTFGDALNCPVWSFTTLADPTVSTFPYSQNFDSSTAPILPLGWTTINANADAYTWETYAGNPQSQPNCARIRFNSTLAMNDWLLMPPMQLTQGNYYKVRFFYRGGNTENPEKLALYWGNSPTADGLSNQIWVNENITNVSYAFGEGVMLAPSTGVYHFGFKGYSDADLFYIYLDTISIDVYVEALNPPRNLTAQVTDFDVQLAWTAPIITRSHLGYKVYRNNVVIATLTDPVTLLYNDTGLSSGLYSYGVTAIYSSGESVPAGPVLADVAPVIPPPANLVATVTDRDVVLNWSNPEGNWITWSGMMLGNSVGTNSAAVFDAAHRWTQDDLVPYAGRSISRIEFVPAYANCIYTIKIWTGGSASGAGTLVHSQVVPTFTLNEWNTVILNAVIPIPTTGDLYYGYECNTQGGTPAGADDGPPVEGKGNMMYFGGAWTTLSILAPTLTYNWSIRAFAQLATLPANAGLEPIVALNNYHLDPEALAVSHFEPAVGNRLVTGYKVYRDAVLVSTITDEEINTYSDLGLPNATYNYSVTSVSSTGESVPATAVAVVNFQLSPALVSDGFEDYPDFATTFDPWILRDIDLLPTNGIDGVSFPGSGEAMAYMIFNPSATTPPLTNLVPHGGAKVAAAFATTSLINNDYLITRRVHLGTVSAIKFFAKSYSPTSLERFRVGVSTLTSPHVQAFQYVSGPEYVEAPAEWHEYVYDLSAYDNMSVFICIRCVSDSAAAFFVDDFSVNTIGGSVGTEDPLVPVISTELLGNYPNPFNPETIIRYNLKENVPVNIEVYNLKGQLVKTLVSEAKSAGSHSVVWKGVDNNNCPVSSGVYFFKMFAGKYSATKKMMLMK